MRHPLGTLLRQEHMLKDADLERVERVCGEHNCSFEEAIARLEILTPETLSAFKEHLPTLALSQLIEIDPNLLDLVPPELARRYQCFPVASIGGTLTIAVADPSDMDVINVLSDHLNRPIDAVPALEVDLAQVIAQQYGESTLEELGAEEEQEPEESNESSTDPDRTPDDEDPGVDDESDSTLTSIIEEHHPDHTRAEVVMDRPGEHPEQVLLANRLVAMMAVREADRLEVRWKGDSQSSAYLFDAEGRHGLAAIPPRLATQVIQRYRVLADLLMVSRQKPQDGTFTVKLRFEDGSYEEKKYRIQVIPIGDIEGEVATLTFVDDQANREATGGVDVDAQPSACPSCGESQVLPGFLYCPMCGIGVG